MLQIFGSKKCKDTAKAERFFKERRVKVHFVDLADKGISKGELQNVLKHIPLDQIIDSDSREFERLNLKYMKYDPVEEILAHPLILKTPIVRTGKKAVSGYNPEAWSELAKGEL